MTPGWPGGPYPYLSCWTLLAQAGSRTVHWMEGSRLGPGQSGGWERPWVVYGLLYPFLHSDLTADVSRAPLTDDLHEDVGSTLLQQGAACGGGLGSPLQALFQAHQVSILSQEGNGRWEGREGGKAKLVLLPATLGIPTLQPLPIPSPSWGTCPICFRWAVRVTRLHQGFTSSQRPAVGESRGE